MLSDPTTEITKETILFYLKEVAGEYRKRAGRRMPAELILIGGASVLINYGFRNMTADIDAVIHASSSMKDAVNTVGDRFGLSNGWLNDDFKRTDSYTPKLAEYSVYYRTLIHYSPLQKRDSQCFCFQIYRCVMISVMMCSAFGIIPFPDLQILCFRVQAPAYMTHLTRRKHPLRFDHMFS